MAVLDHGRPMIAISGPAARPAPSRPTWEPRGLARVGRRGSFRRGCGPRHPVWLSASSSLVRLDPSGASGARVPHRPRQRRKPTSFLAMAQRRGPASLREIVRLALRDAESRSKRPAPRNQDQVDGPPANPMDPVTPVAATLRPGTEHGVLVRESCLRRSP